MLSRLSGSFGSARPTAVSYTHLDVYKRQANANSGNGAIISLDEARTLVLARVPGATANDVRIQLDRDDGRQIYEGEIYYNQMEYEFEIDASSGNIIAVSYTHLRLSGRFVAASSTTPFFPSKPSISANS